jgi:hypothetical protein
MKLNKICELRVQEFNSLDYVIIRSPMTVEFSIDRHTWASASTADFRIYNLSEETRGLIFRDRFEFWDPLKWDPNKPASDNNRPGNVQFYAGYEGDGQTLPMIFNGQLFYGHSTRRGPEYVTELECQDFAIFQYATSSALTLKAGVNKNEVIQALYKDLAVRNGVIGPGFNTPNGNSRGLVLQGDTIKLLTDISEGKFFADLGIPIAIKDNEVLDNPAIQVITSKTGLINIPTKTNYQVIATMLFTPELMVGQYIRVDTGMRGGYDGEYKVIGIKHSGVISGTHDSQTITTVSMVLLTAPPILIPLPGGSNG